MKRLNKKLGQTLKGGSFLLSNPDIIDAFLRFAAEARRTIKYQYFTVLFIFCSDCSFLFINVP